MVYYGRRFQGNHLLDSFSTSNMFSWKSQSGLESLIAPNYNSNIPKQYCWLDGSRTVRLLLLLKALSLPCQATRGQCVFLVLWPHFCSSRAPTIQINWKCASAEPGDGGSRKGLLQSALDSKVCSVTRSSHRNTNEWPACKLQPF